MRSPGYGKQAAPKQVLRGRRVFGLKAGSAPGERIGLADAHSLRGANGDRRRREPGHRKHSAKRVLLPRYGAALAVSNQLRVNGLETRTRSFGGHDCTC